MRRIFLVITLVALLTAPVGAAAAANNTTSTPESVAPQEVSIELSPTTTISDWEIQNGTWQITVRTKAPTRVTVVDAAALAAALTEGDGAASATVSTRSYNLAPGTTTISFDGSAFNGMSAVTLTTTRSNTIAVIRTEALATGSKFIKMSTAGLLVGLAVVGTGYGTYKRVVSKLEDEEKEVKRHL
jgi:hypothetical protein